MSGEEKNSNGNSGTAATNSNVPFRVRSRFPKVMPNVSGSTSGIARIRRLSGHFSSSSTIPNESTENSNNVLLSTTNAEKTPPLTPLAVNLNAASPFKHQISENLSSPSTTSTLQEFSKNTSTISISSSSNRNEPVSKQIDQIKHRLPFISKINSPSPKLIEDHLHNSNSNNLNPPLTPNTNQTPNQFGITFRQFVSYQNSVLHQQHPGVTLVPSSPAQPPTPIVMPTTPGGSIYNPKFSTEHIMNIIKFKALQKLKKIESESLKERRKKYLTGSLCSANTNHDLRKSLQNGDISTSEIDRSKLRMRDLLYYNSRNKKPDQNEIIVEIAENPIENNTTENEIIISTTPNEDAMEVSARLTRSLSPSSLSNDSINSNLNPKKTPDDASPAKEPQFAAPQLKFAEDGSIIIDQESLIIQREKVTPVFDSTVVESENVDNLTYNSYRKFHHTKKWTEKETAKFYKALSMIGTDFTMIQRLFSNRSRDEIKRKFKREEKLNQALIDKILTKTSQIDLSCFISASSDDEAAKSNEAKTTKKGKRKKKDQENEETTKKDDEASSSNTKEKKPRQKLKRIKKRQFVELESETEENNNQDENNKNSSPKNKTNELNSVETTKKKQIMKKKPKEVNDKSSNVSDSQKIADTINNVIETFGDSTINIVNSNNNNNNSCTSSGSSNPNNFQPIVQYNKQYERNCSSPLPPCSTLLTSNNNFSFVDNSVIYSNNQESVSSKPQVEQLNKENFESKSSESDESDEEDEEEIVLDLDNNAIISSNSVINIDYRPGTSSGYEQQISSVNLGDNFYQTNLNFKSQNDSQIKMHLEDKNNKNESFSYVSNLPLYPVENPFYINTSLNNDNTSMTINDNNNDNINNKIRLEHASSIQSINVDKSLSMIDSSNLNSPTSSFMHNPIIYNTSFCGSNSENSTRSQVGGVSYQSQETEEEEEENVILDLDNNKIITNSSILNIEYNPIPSRNNESKTVLDSSIQNNEKSVESTETPPTRPVSKSKIVITKINKNPTN